ncbi:PIG-L family deacetylase [Streptomyces vinaceus]
MPLSEGEAALLDTSSPRGDQPTVHVQICAHLDDDLYFMNPDLQRAVRSGDEVLSIFLTAGEDDGKNALPDSVKYRNAPRDFSGYYGARVHGSQAAYAHMSGKDRSASWIHETVGLASGALAEHVFLEDAPHIGLILFSLAKRSRTGAVSSLHHLWEERIDQQDTLLRADSPITSVQQFTKADLIEDLAQLLVGLRPHVVRTLNPLPQKSAEAEGDVTSHDHREHEASALFAHAAIDRARRHGLSTTMLTYRGYENKYWPSNLDKTRLQEKHLTLTVYGRGRPNQPGDRKVGDAVRKRPYGNSCAVRRNTGAISLLRTTDGSCYAVGSLSASPVMWVPGASPSPEMQVAPDSLPGARILSDLAIVSSSRGLEVFALRSQSDEPLRRRTLEVVSARGSLQEGFTPWTTLGNPYERKAWYKQFGIGAPAAALGGDDRSYVFVRNFGSGLSCRIADKEGTWGKWLDLGGADLDTDLTTITSPDGCVHVFGNTPEGILCWSQEMSGGGFSVKLLKVGPPAGPPDVSLTDGGDFLVFWRTAESGEVGVIRMSPLDGNYTPPQLIGWGAGGTGRIAVTADPRQPATWLATRNAHGMAEFVCLLGDNLASVRRGIIPLPIIGGLAWAQTQDGQPLLATVTPIGNLMFCPTNS